MAETKQTPSKSRTRGSRGKKKGKKQSSAAASASTTSSPPSRSTSPPPRISSNLLAPVLDQKCRCGKSSYTSTATQTVESSFTTATTSAKTPLAVAAASTAPPSPARTASSSSPSASSPPSTISPCSPISSDLNILLSDPLTTTELAGWETGIKTARSASRRAKWSAMLREEIRQRGVEGMQPELLEQLAASYL